VQQTYKSDNHEFSLLGQYYRQQIVVGLEPKIAKPVKPSSQICHPMCIMTCECTIPLDANLFHKKSFSSAVINAVLLFSRSVRLSNFRTLCGGGGIVKFAYNSPSLWGKKVVVVEWDDEDSIRNCYCTRVCLQSSRWLLGS
jgi:hypothetical protein